MTSSTAQADAQLDAEASRTSRRLVRRLADCRYAGQGYEVRFDVPAGAGRRGLARNWRRRFHDAHEAEYGHRFDAEIEIINIRVGRPSAAIPDLRRPEASEAAIPRGAPEARARGDLRRQDGKPSRRRPVLRARQRWAWRSHRRAGDHRAVRLHHRHSARIRRPDRPLGNIVDRLHRRGARPRSAAELATPILMRVIGGAFSAIAKEMAGVLFRMAYSSIIRESEDLGAGIFDTDGNVLAESDSTPMFMGAMPKIVKGVISLLGDDIHEGDVILHNDPYLRRHALARRGDRRSRSSSTASSSASPAPRRTSWTSAARTPGSRSTSWTTGPRATSTARSSSPRRACGRTALPAHPGEHPHADLQPRRHRGDDRRLRAGQAPLPRAARALRQAGGARGAGESWLDYSERMLRQEIAKLPDGVYETEVGWLDDDGRNRGVQLPVKVEGDRRGRRDDYRPDRLERRGADGLQLPLRGHDGFGDDIHHAHDLPRRGRLPGVRAPERGDAAAASK